MDDKGIPHDESQHDIKEYLQCVRIKNMLFRSRRAVAPVIATLLMVAIAVVGGMLVFVFAQDFFTSTDTMTGPTIEILQLYGYDARDLGDDDIESHAGETCNSENDLGADLQDGDTFAVYVRNLGANDVIIGDVSVFNTKGTAAGVTTLANGGAAPAPGEWVVVTGLDCAGGNFSASEVVGSGQDATILIVYDDVEFGDPVKLGRPIFVKVETSSGNIFTKQIVNGRQVG